MIILLRQSWLLLASELRQELRHMELLVNALFFAGVVLVILVLTLNGIPSQSQFRAVPGALWLGVAFTGALALSRIFDREREGDMLNALLCSPTEILAIYIAKVAFGTLLLSVCAVLYVPGLAFAVEGGMQLVLQWPLSLLILFLGCFGYSVIAAFFSAALARSGGKSLLLSMILYPLSTPVLLTALVATQRLVEGADSVLTAVAQLAAVDVALFTLACFLFESMLAPGRASASSPRRS